jgi:hypothetical protein
MAQITCKNCSTENDFYQLNCVKCGSLIRARIVNIDLWHIIWLVIDSPKKAFQNIIHAEHKNFVVLLGILASLKIYFDVQFSSNIIFGQSPDISRMMLYMAASILLFFLLLVLLSLFIRFLNSRQNINTRFKDNVAVYIYSLLPLVIGLILLAPVEYALFGNHWLVFDPSPFVIKSGPAWILASLEIALRVWSIILTITATFASTGKVLYSILIGVMVHLVIHGVYYAVAAML